MALVVVGCGGGVPAATSEPASIVAPPSATDRPAQATHPPASQQPDRPGGIDNSFGIGGQRTTDMGGTDDHAYATVVTPDGSTIVAGEARRDANSLVSFALANYSPGGRLDPTFGTGGLVFTTFDEFNSSGALAVALQSDGKIVAVGHAPNPDVHHETFALARYNADGCAGRLVSATGPRSDRDLPRDRRRAIRPCERRGSRLPGPNRCRR